VFRTAICTCCLAVLTAAPVTAQEWAKKMFEATNHDFGSVARGGKAEFRFEFKNIYKEDVHVSSVTSSCGCTTPTVTQDTLKTYEKSAILAHFNTGSFLGHKNATLTVTFDKPFYAQVQLHVAGDIRSDVVLNPGGIEFGSVDRGQSAEKEVSITYAGRNDWKILGVRSGNPHLETEIVEKGRGGGKVTYQLRVRLKEDAPVGYVNEQLVLLTNDQRSTQFPVAIEGRVLSDITINPSSLFLGVLKPGSPVTKRLVVQGKKPFHITNIVCEDGDCFEFTLSEEAKTVHVVPVTFRGSDKPGRTSHKIRIETDLGGESAAVCLAHAEIIGTAGDNAGGQ